MKTVLAKIAATLAAVVACTSITIAGFPGTAQAGVACTPKHRGVDVYAVPKPQAPPVRELTYGKEYGCGSTANSQFWNVSHHGHHVGYVYRSDMRR